MATRKRSRGKAQGAALPPVRMGRPTGFTPQLGEDLIQLRTTTLLFDGQIAVRCGISRDTLAHWLKLGMRGDDRYVDFAQRYTAAKIDLEANRLEKAAGSFGEGQRWWLERAHPKRYGTATPAGGPEDAIEITDLIREIEEQPQTLVELLRNPPPELQDAMVECAAEIRAFLDAAAPLLVPTNGQGDDGAIGGELSNGEG